MHVVHAWCLRRLEEDIRSPITGALDGCELTNGCWQSNLCPLQKQKVLLAVEPQSIETSLS